MSLGLAFYIILLIWAVFGVWWNWPNQQVVGGNLMMFVLFLLLGWRVFGAPLHG